VHFIWDHFCSGRLTFTHKVWEPGAARAEIDFFWKYQSPRSSLVKEPPDRYGHSAILTDGRPHWRLFHRFHPLFAETLPARGVMEAPRGKRARRFEARNNSHLQPCILLLSSASTCKYREAAKRLALGEMHPSIHGNTARLGNERGSRWYHQSRSEPCSQSGCHTKSCDMCARAIIGQVFEFLRIAGGVSTCR
jgi:hypothetical protein